ncbi:MAG TPA: helix-turn-helix domain-containing protein [Solirubrobacterales bacterium]
MVARKSEKDSGVLDQRLAKALAHPLRVRILEVINERPISPVAFTRELDGPALSQVSYHFRVLEKHGCIECIEEVKRRGSMEHIYQGTRRALFGDADWAKLPKSIQGGVSATMLNGLLTKAVRSFEAGSFDARPDRHISWISTSLDQQGWDNFIALLASMLDQVMELQAEAAERLAGSGETGIPVTFGALGFESSPEPAKREAA